MLRWTGTLYSFEGAQKINKGSQWNGNFTGCFLHFVRAQTMGRKIKFCVRMNRKSERRKSLLRIVYEQQEDKIWVLQW